MRTRRALVALTLTLAGLAGLSTALSRPDLGFTTLVSAKLAEAYGERFGGAAPQRLEDWKGFARERKGARAASERELLSLVNRRLNLIRFEDDAVHWGLQDYWATPAESVASNGADCEDFSIAKYFLLKELGVPVSRLRLTYVKALRLNQAHMVLAYYAAPDAVPLVLDNLEDSVRPATERADLLPVYSFNDEELRVVASGRAGSPGQIRNWTDLIARLEREAKT